MKKNFIAIVLLIAFTANLSYAQLNLKIGPKIGFNASRLHLNTDSISSQFKSGFQLGIFVRMGKKVYLQPELYYTTQGGVFDCSIHNWKQNIKIGSLDLPVLIGVSFINSELLNVRVLAGPAVSFVVNKNIGEMSSVVGPITNSNINNVNWYIQAGAGIDLWKLTLDIRYQFGLNKMVNEVIYHDVKYNFSTSNNVWVVSLGFKFL